MPTVGVQNARAKTNRVLSNLARGYKNDSRVGSALFPVVGVGDYGGIVITFDSSEFVINDDSRAPGGTFNAISDGYNGDAYQLETRGLRYLLPREIDHTSSQIGIDWGVKAKDSLMKATTLRLEYQQAQIATNPANYLADNITVVSDGLYWGGDGASSVDPEDQILEIKSKISSQIGVDPNVCILGREVADGMFSNQKIRDRIRYTSKDSVTLEMLSSMYNTKFYSGDAIMKRSRNSPSERVWGNYAIFSYVPEFALNGQRIPFAPDGKITRYEPSGFFTYMFDGHPELTDRYWVEDRDTWCWKIRSDRAPVISMRGANYLVINPVKPKV